MDAFNALLRQHGYAGYQVTALLLSGAGGVVALLPLKILPCAAIVPNPQVTRADAHPRGCNFKTWARENGFSRSTAYRLPPDLRPKIVKIGNLSIVTLEAHREWEARMRACGTPQSEG